VASLYRHGFTLPDNLPGVTFNQRTGAQLISLQTKEGDVLDLDLRNVVAYDGIFAFLPLDVRIWIEKRDMLKTIGERLKAEYTIDSEPLPEPPMPEPGLKEQKKGVRRAILEWKVEHGDDAAPTEAQFRKLVAKAQKNTRKEFRAARKGEQKRKLLTWEQQWRRADRFRTLVLINDF
jgi:hypothetical protein